MFINRKIINHIKLLKSLEEAVKNRDILFSHQKDPLTKILCREALTNFLIAEVLKFAYKNNPNFSFDVCQNLDTDVHDGFILFSDIAKRTKHYFELEQVALTDKDQHMTNQDINFEIIKKIKDKHNKKYSDYNEVILNIFLDIRSRKISLTPVKKFLKKESKFKFYHLVLLDGNYSNIPQRYVYTVTDIIPERNYHTRRHILIPQSFDCWKVFEYPNHP